MLPSLGPIYASRREFAHLPVTGVSGLQEALLDQRTEFLRDASASGAAQSIGAFASLHVSIFFTAALATLLLGLGRFVKIGVWVLFALTVVATIYFGWHYVLDDLAGLVIAVAALALAGRSPGSTCEPPGGRCRRGAELAMASRTLLEPGRETRRRDEAAPRAREHAPAAAPARRAGRTDRGRPSRSSSG